MFVRRRLDHSHEGGHLRVGELLDEPEVQEGDATVAVEQVVARVRIAVEPVHAVEAAEDESEEALAGEVALVLRPLDHLLPRGAGDEVAGQHP